MRSINSEVREMTEQEEEIKKTKKELGVHEYSISEKEPFTKYFFELESEIEDIEKKLARLNQTKERMKARFNLS